MLTAYGYRCVYCGHKLQRLTQDHITPISKGGNHQKTSEKPRRSGRGGQEVGLEGQEVSLVLRTTNVLYLKV